MPKPYFSELFPVLAERSKQAAIGRLGFTNPPLRRHLATLFGQAYGETGAFLANPAFEAVFGWKSADQSLSALAGGLLCEPMVNALDNPPDALRDDYRFARDQHPYTHQLKAWEILARDTAQSVVVASGTGSGKTECFMVPILDRLAREVAQGSGELVGVRALFLYPLNALINSQRERLRAWTHRFDGKVRFCLYNGTTPDELPQRERNERPNEVVDRTSLRGAPPPILVTNATMLEYMLVRTEDRPILEQSQGLLEWVVLDEAHTYIGSQAAEAALLLRRVLLAFGVQPDRVRFVATSATIGDPEGEAGQQLKRFLKDVAGVAEDRVHIVAGEREIPQIQGVPTDTPASLDDVIAIEPEQLHSAQRYRALASHPTARRLRTLFVGEKAQPAVATLNEMCGILFNAASHPTREQQSTALRWVDLLSQTRDSEARGGHAYLPVRAHLFHQSLSGLWACADAQCRCRAGTELDNPDWPFGAVYLDPRKHCECGSPAYELVCCDDCGSPHLLAGIDNGTHTVAHLLPPGTVDEFELEVEAEEDDVRLEGTDEDEATEMVNVAAGQDRLLIVNRNLAGVETFPIQRDSRKLAGDASKAVTVLALEDDESGLVCPVCGSQDSPQQRQFQSSRLGAPFLLGNILPNLLEFAPDSDQPEAHPYRGRRLLSFNDSRQGTARMAARLQQNAERDRVRGLVYHFALQQGGQAATHEAIALQSEIDVLTTALQAMPEDNRAPIEAMVQIKRAELQQLKQLKPISFADLATHLATHAGGDFKRMLDHYRKQAGGIFTGDTGPVELASMFLVREFGRRPKRQNSLETMGMIAVQYPALNAIQDVPAMARNASGFTLEEWRDFLKMCLDFFVRSGGSLGINPSWRNWLGMRFPMTALVPSTVSEKRYGQRFWPQCKPAGLNSTLVRLLAHVLAVDIKTPDGQDRVDVILKAAWDALCNLGLLAQKADGRVLELKGLAFLPMQAAWLCPYTNRFLDVTLHGHSPYTPRGSASQSKRCERVEIPLYPEAFSGGTDDLLHIQKGREWLSHNPAIEQLREKAYWSNPNDRVIELAPYLTAAEHSAQQDSQSLDQYEKAFKQGELNLLSCSTTMEMGIDIGGISMVAMNNAPPHPANYLQRAGRAGRRRETRSLAMTLCKPNPHDQAIFRNSRWAFDTLLPAPKVSLDSPLIVERHVNAFLLSNFLSASLTSSKQDKLKLQAGAFFLPATDSLSARFVDWCQSSNQWKAPELETGLARIARYSAFEGLPAAQLLQRSGDRLGGIAGKWRVEWDNLNQEKEAICGKGKSTVACKAVEIRLMRIEQEYLLRELATRGFLPAYGFPSHIASFDNLTASRMAAVKANDRSREDNRYRRRELASRDMTTALREYAPGAEVVIDGIVYESAGLTLNWHVPASNTDVREIQNIRFAWRCSKCGASGSSSSLDTARHCDACDAEIEANKIRQFIQPSGYAVDFYKAPSNNVESQRFIPVEQPEIDARGEWQALANPALGRFRATHEGRVFNYSLGLHRRGYSLCLECGRAEPIVEDGKKPKGFQKPHQKLRRDKDNTGECPGSHSDWKILPQLALGHETTTDICELQIRTEDGVWLNDTVVASTLAVALRLALARLIGVQASELGCAVKPARSESGGTCRSILLYDRFAAGYTAGIERYLDRLFAEARKLLASCPASCDSACPQCILEFDQRFEAEKLDRHEALKVLTESWLQQLVLPQPLRFFGDASKMTYRNLDAALLDALRTREASSVRLYATGSAETWDMAPSPLRSLAYRLAAQQTPVEIALPEQTVSALEAEGRYLLASLADTPNVRVLTLKQEARCGEGWLLAEVVHGDTAMVWGTNEESALAFDTAWGFPAALVHHAAASPSGLSGTALTAASLRPKREAKSDAEIEILTELDGPYQGFGSRFWALLASQHSETRQLLADQHDEVTGVGYQDRYLFSPLSVAILVEVVAALRENIGQGRWAAPVTIKTAVRRADAAPRSHHMLWSDWNDMTVRNQVLSETFGYLGMGASVESHERTQALMHGRLLEINWASGKRLTIRFDQGVSYWRVAQEERDRGRYPFLDRNPLEQARYLAEMKLNLVGDSLPTQIFVKCR